MKYVTKILFTGVLIISMGTCKPTGNTNSDAFFTANLIESMNQKEVGLLSDFVEEVEMVVLDGQGEWFVPKGVIYGNYYENYTVYLDKRNKNVCVFGKEGRLQFVLNKPGKGPGEFSNPTDAGMDNLEKKVFVFESYRRKIHWYDLSGSWIESINLPTSLKHVLPLPEGGFLYQNDQSSNDELDSCRLMMADKSGIVKRCIWDNGPKNRDKASFQDACWLMPNSKGGHYYRDLYLGDTIYSLDSCYNLNPVLVMNAGKHRLPADLALDFNKRDLWKNYLRTHAYCSVPQGFLIAGNMEDKVYFHIDIKNRKVKCIKEIKDDLMGFRGIPIEMSVDGQYLVKMVRIQHYSGNAEGMFVSKEVKYPEIQARLKTVAQNGNDQIDIVLLLYKLKQ